MYEVSNTFRKLAGFVRYKRMKFQHRSGQVRKDNNKPN